MISIKGHKMAVRVKL